MEGDEALFLKYTGRFEVWGLYFRAYLGRRGREDGGCCERQLIVCLLHGVRSRGRTVQ